MTKRYLIYKDWHMGFIELNEHDIASLNPAEHTTHVPFFLGYISLNGRWNGMVYHPDLVLTPEGMALTKHWDSFKLQEEIAQLRLELIKQAKLIRDGVPGDVVNTVTQL